MTRAPSGGGVNMGFRANYAKASFEACGGFMQRHGMVCSEARLGCPDVRRQGALERCQGGGIMRLMAEIYETHVGDF